MTNTKRPLQEKMSLFWHGVHCTGFAKTDHGRMNSEHINLFREHGLGNFRNLLLELSRHPTMVHYLDNVDNHKGSINENYGRELLELFSLGVGMDGKFNYTEDDVKAASRSVHRLDQRAHSARFPLRAGEVEVPLRPDRPRRQREDLPGRDR